MNALVLKSTSGFNLFHPLQAAQPVCAGFSVQICCINVHTTTALQRRERTPHPTNATAPNHFPARAAANPPIPTLQTALVSAT